MVLSCPLIWTSSVLRQHICPWLVCLLHSIERQDRTFAVILAKHCIELPDDGSLVIRNMLEQFKYYKYFIIILIVSTNYIFAHLLDNKVF